MKAQRDKGTDAAASVQIQKDDMWQSRTAEACSLGQQGEWRRQQKSQNSLMKQKNGTKVIFKQLFNINKSYTRSS
jgi:hypothetical protein